MTTKASNVIRSPSTAVLSSLLSSLRLTPAAPKSSSSSLQKACFTTTTQRSAGAKVKGRIPQDKRIRLLRYHLNHPLRLTPRPLRFSRTRALRHWAIHRAWQLHQAKMRKTAELALERQYNSMRSACEELRNLGDTGLLGTADDKILVDKDGRRVDVGWLYRRAMEKKGIWGEVPREYAGRMVVDYPSKKGWNDEWVR